MFAFAPHIIGAVVAYCQIIVRDHSDWECILVKPAINADGEWTYDGIWHGGK